MVALGDAEASVAVDTGGFEASVESAG